MTQALLSFTASSFTRNDEVDENTRFSIFWLDNGKQIQSIPL